MSLRVWLPLTKDLRNQGLSSVTPTQTSGFTKITAGKLGGCYKFTDVFDTLLPLSEWDWTTQSVSFGCWAKISKTELSTLAEVPSYSSTYTTMGGTLLGRDSYGGIAIRWQTNNIYTDSVLNKLYVYTHIRNTNSQTNQTSSQEVPFDTWFHIMTVIDRNDSQIKLYLNGELVKSVALTVTGTFATGTFRIAEATWHGGNGNTSSGCWQLNDVRVYDHALSPLEVKHIAQGLILHYPLNREGWGNDNILINTHFDSQTTKTSGWDTTKNGTQMASSWGGFNGGVSNPSTVYHAHLKQVNNEWVYEYIRTADEGWLDISQGGLQLKLIAGKTYTFSWEEYRVEGNNYPTGGLYYFKTGATSANFHLGQFGGSHGNVLGKWRKFSYTFVAPTDGDYSKNMSWYIYGQSGGNGKMYIRHPKLEEGSVATPWCPNSSDALATTMGLNDNVEYDCSGYCNNGEYYAYDTNGSISYTSDTPKYNVSTRIASANPTQSAASGTRYLYGHCKLTNPTQMSVAFWLKPITGGYGSTTSNVQGYFCTTNYEYGDTSVGVDYQASAMNHRDGTVDMNDSASTTQCRVTFYPTIGEWHHYVYTYDGQVGRGYKDGVQTATAQFSAAKTLDSFIGVVIGFSKARGVWRRNDACYSDFRVYATALSAEDVKDLYELGATIDTNGTLSTYEFAEQ